MSRILVTGSTGFVGKPTVAALIAAGHDVRVLGDATDGHGYMTASRRKGSTWPASRRGSSAAAGRVRRSPMKFLRAGGTDPRGFALVANANPLGMHPEDPLTVEVAHLSADQFVADVVTRPVVPALIAAARAAGCRMLLADPRVAQLFLGGHIEDAA